MVPKIVIECKKTYGDSENGIFLYFFIGIFGSFIYTDTCWSYVWPETLRDSSRGWFPEEWRKQSSTASSCSSYWPACMWHNPTYKMSSGPRGCRSLMGLEIKKKSQVEYYIKENIKQFCTLHPWHLWIYRLRLQVNIWVSSGDRDGSQYSLVVYPMLLHECNIKRHKGQTHSNQLEEPDSRPASRARPWGSPKPSFAWSSSGWCAGAWWSPRSGRRRWPAGWSWRWCQTGRHRRRIFYSLANKPPNHNLSGSNSGIAACAVSRNRKALPISPNTHSL